VLIDSGGGHARQEDVEVSPTQRHISPSILVYEVNNLAAEVDQAPCPGVLGGPLVERHKRRERALACGERVLYSQPTGPNPLDHRDD